MSAMGFLAAPMAFDFVRTRPMALDTGSDWQEVMQLIEAMEEEGRAILGRTIDPATITFRRFADMRYRKQGYEIRVPLPDDRLDAGALDRVRAQFDETYRGRYGHNVPNTPVDIVSWRVVAQGPKPSLALPRRSGVAGTSLKGERMAWSAERRCMVAVPVHDRYALAEGTVLHGPVIVEERESTVVIGEGAVVGVDGACNLIVEMPAEAPSKGSL